MNIRTLAFVILAAATILMAVGLWQIINRPEPPEQLEPVKPPKVVKPTGKVSVA